MNTSSSPVTASAGNTSHNPASGSRAPWVNEAHYAEMWAQDAAAMYGYAGSSATASQVTPFSWAAWSCARPPVAANGAVDTVHLAWARRIRVAQSQSMIAHTLVDNWQSAVYVAVKTLALFLTAALAFRFLQRRDRPIHLFDWLTAIVAGSVIGRAATATDTSWIGGVAALLTVIAANAAVTRLRFVPGLRAVIDPPLRVLIRDGKVDHRNLRRCGITAGGHRACAVRANGLGFHHEVVNSDVHWPDRRFHTRKAVTNCANRRVSTSLPPPALGLRGHADLIARTVVEFWNVAALRRPM